MRKIWAFVGTLSVFGLVFIALPQLPTLSLSRWDGLFSVAWLLLASLIFMGHGTELLKTRPKKKRNVATVSLRPPRRVRGQS